MSILGLIIFSVVVVTASADVGHDAGKVSSVVSDLVSILDESGLPEQFKRISRSGDVEERFGLITGSLRLLVGLVKSVVNYFLSWFVPKQSVRPVEYPPHTYYPPVPVYPYQGK